MGRTINILGVTGSIGQSAANVIAANPDRFDVQMICAHTDVDGLARTARRLRAKTAIIAHQELHGQLGQLLADTGIEVLAGEEAIIERAGQSVDITLAAIVGMAGLTSLMPAIKNSKAVAIANKEPLVAAGALVMQAARAHGTQILPVDSEHNAIFQLFDFNNKNDIDRIVLTASGGPFLNSTIEEMAGATPAQAVAHPNWSMGAKISVDSATMMNKALEIIEAHYLFDLPPEKIEVLIHPQSVVHGMVEYKDGSVLAQMGASDMCTPLARVLDYPQRLATSGKRLDFKALSQLDFMAVDHQKFPAIVWAYECLERGQYACLALNAANEVAVENFLAQKIGFLDILKIVGHILTTLSPCSLDEMDDIYTWDSHIRDVTSNLINDEFINTKVKYA